MIKYKDFLIRMCEVENLTIKELQKLTGKSQSVVYEWLNYNNVSSFPSYDSLSKILCRLGITLDNFIKCKSNRLVDYTHYRTYSDYIVGHYDNQYFSKTILDDQNRKFILNCYIDDCFRLKSLVNDYLNGIEINIDEFDILCENINPSYVSDAVFFDEFTDLIIDYLCSPTLPDYKMRKEYYDELVENDPEFATNKEHEIYIPSANYLVLYEASDDISILKKYILLLNKTEKKVLMENYISKCMFEPDYDKNKRIAKFLVKNNCGIRNGIDEKIVSTYEQLINNLKEVSK